MYPLAKFVGLSKTVSSTYSFAHGHPVLAGGCRAAWELSCSLGAVVQTHVNVNAPPYRGSWEGAPTIHVESIYRAPGMREVSGGCPVIAGVVHLFPPEGITGRPIANEGREGMSSQRKLRLPPFVVTLVRLNPKKGLATTKFQVSRWPASKVPR